MHDLKSNIVFKTPKEITNDVRFMCVSKKVFLALCDMFPVTANNIKEQGLKKRLHYLRAMEKLEKNSVHKSLKRSINKKIEDGIVKFTKVAS